MEETVCIVTFPTTAGAMAMQVERSIHERGFGQWSELLSGGLVSNA